MSLLLLLCGGLLCFVTVQGRSQTTLNAMFATFLALATLGLLWLTIGTGPPPKDRVVGGNYGGALFRLDDFTVQLGAKLSIGGGVARFDPVAKSLDEVGDTDPDSSGDDLVIRAGKLPLEADLATLTSAANGATLAWKTNERLLIQIIRKDGSRTLAGATILDNAMCNSRNIDSCNLRQQLRLRVSGVVETFSLGMVKLPFEAPFWQVALTGGGCAGGGDDLRALAAGDVWSSSTVVICAGGKQVDSVAEQKLAVLGSDAGRIVVEMNGLQAGTATIEPGDRLIMFALASESEAQQNLPVRPGRIVRVLDLQLASAGIASGNQAIWRFSTPPALSAEGSLDGTRVKVRLASSAYPELLPPKGQQLLRFSQLGSTFEAQLAATRLILPEAGNDRLEIASEADAELIDGSTLRIKGAKADLDVSMWVWNASYGSLDRLFWLALVALTCNWLATQRLRREQSSAMILLAAVDLLLVMRLAMATEAMVVDVDTEWLKLPANAVLLIASLPVAVALPWPPLVPPAAGRWRRDLCWCLVVAFLVLALTRLAVPAPELKQAVIAAVLPMIGWAVCHLPGFGRWLAGQSGFRWLAVAAAAMGRGLASGWGMVVAGLVLGAYHVAFQERGLGIATTVLLVPGLVLLFGGVLAWASRHEDSTSQPYVRAGLWFWLGWFVVVAISSYFISDTGLAIALFWPFALASAWCWLLAHPNAGWREWRAPGSLALLMVLAVTAWFNQLKPVADLPGFTALSPQLPAWAGQVSLVAVALGLAAAGTAWAVRSQLGRLFMLGPIAAVAALAFVLVVAPELPGQNVTLAEANQIDANSARLVGAFAPNRLAAAGTNAAAEFESAKMIMREYVNPSIDTGKGMYGMRPPRALTETQLSDHAAAVHLLFPHGKLAGLGVALLLAVPALLALQARAAPFQAAYWQAVLAGLTFSLASFYVLLANLEVLPFTGRDMYLLAPVSGANPLEAALLLMLLARWLGRGGQAA